MKILSASIFSPPVSRPKKKRDETNDEENRDKEIFPLFTFNRDVKSPAPGAQEAHGQEAVRYARSMSGQAGAKERAIDDEDASVAGGGGGKEAANDDD